MRHLADRIRSGFLDRATLWLAWLAAAALIFMVVIISAGVVLRYVFGAPVLGLNEIIQLTAVALVMAALPYCTEANGHVGVDVFDEAIGPRGRLFGDILSRVLPATGVASRLALNFSSARPPHRLAVVVCQAPPCWRAMKPLARRPRSSFHAGSSSTVSSRRAPFTSPPCISHHQVSPCSVLKLSLLPW